ncbi:MAG: molybdopterin-dependent oxidoreductase [Rhodobacteraceae bacterium]|nr:molybdopterin-dependent oxidoreductase [Paracoccaceae bacterium]
MKRTFIGVLVLLFAACTGSITLSQELEVAPVSGGTSMVLSLDDLRDLGETELRTGNEFVDGERLFRGPLVRDVLRHAGADNATLVRLTAANDYQVEIAAEEFMKYEVILALSMDGVPLSMRDKGPIWVIYPISSHAELQDPVFNNRLIWQLVKLEYR